MSIAIGPRFSIKDRSGGVPALVNKRWHSHCMQPIALARRNITIIFQYYLALGKNLLFYSWKLLEDVHNSQVITENSKKGFSSFYLFDSIERPRVRLNSPETEPQCSPNFFRFPLWHFVVNALLHKGLFLIKIQTFYTPILSN
jgi:hypothetical protein